MVRWVCGVTQLRRDAARNRAALIAAGRDVFAERGPDASLEEIARRADVGIGTLYRHFPTREALIEVIFEEHFDQVVAAAEAAAADEDAWEGIVGFLERVLAARPAGRARTRAERRARRLHRR